MSSPASLSYVPIPISLSHTLSSLSLIRSHWTFSRFVVCCSSIRIFLFRRVLSVQLGCGWSRYAQFSLAVVNQMHTKFTVRKDTQHQFHGRENDWGFTSFMPLSDLYDPSKGSLVNDTYIIEADVAVRKVIDYWSYDSKKETGYVGLKNQGATCYMNSFLQTLYHIPYGRKAVYHMPTTENDMPSGSIPLALQSLFYKLQYNELALQQKN